MAYIGGGFLAAADGGGARSRRGVAARTEWSEAAPMGIAIFIVRDGGHPDVDTFAPAKRLADGLRDPARGVAVREGAREACASAWMPGR